MKSFKLLLLILVLSVLPWAQTSAPDSSSKAQNAVQSQCPCCQKMADSKDAKGGCPCMSALDGKAMACCAGKNGKSCMKGMAAGSKAGCCGGQGKCSRMKGDKSAMACCRGKQCGMQGDPGTDPMK